MPLSIIFSLFFCLLIKFITAKESEIELEKIKNVTISMFEIYTNDSISFSLRYKITILKFFNFAYFDLLSNDMNIFQDDRDSSKYILKNITIFFISQIQLNNFTTTKIDCLFEVNFDTFIFQNKTNFLKILDATPSSVYISQNSQIGQLSFFNQFNKLENATFFDENGKKFENINIISTFLNLSKTLIIKKISNVQKHFNLLTYDLDQILNKIIGNSYICPSHYSDIYYISSIYISNIDIPFEYIYFDEGQLIIDRMNVSGSYYSKIFEERFVSFSFYNDDKDNIFFEKEFYSLIDIKSDKLIYKGGLQTKNKVRENLDFLLKRFIDEVIEEYYSL